MKKKSILIIGLGKFGTQMAITLSSLGHDIMAVDSQEEKVNEAMPYVTEGRIGDSTNVAFLKELGVENYDLCFVTIGGDFQSSLETTFSLKELNAKRVISRAESDAQAKFLLRNGADEIIYPEKQLANWFSIKYSMDNILDYIELDSQFSIFEVEVPKTWIGKTILQVDIRKKYNINIIAIKENGVTNVNFTPDYIFTKEATLLVIGEYKAIEKCFNI